MTISASTTLSTPRPALLANGPWPPPVLQPIIPTDDANPEETNLPYSEAALWISVKTNPGPSLTISFALSKVIFFIKEVLIKSPSLQPILECLFIKSWPVPATLTQRSWVFAN